MRYAIVIEKANGNYSAYVPDLPGCVATGATVKDTEREIRDAIRFHIDGLKEDGQPVPDADQHRRLRRGLAGYLSPRRRGLMCCGSGSLRLDQFEFCQSAAVGFRDRFKQPPGIGRTAKQVERFHERLRCICTDSCQ